MGQSCWRARLAIQQLFPTQIFFPFPIFKLLPNFIFQCQDLKLGRPTYFFLLFSFLVLTKCQVLNLRVGRSRDQVLQRAYCESCLIRLCTYQFVTSTSPPPTHPTPRHSPGHLKFFIFNGQIPLLRVRKAVQIPHPWAIFFYCVTRQDRFKTNML